MADTKHHAPLPVEGDGVDYRAIVWFLVILTGTVVFCQLFVWGLFVFMDSRAVASDVSRSPVAAEPSKPVIDGGRLVTGLEVAPSGGAVPRPGLLLTEPTVLHEYRRSQDAMLQDYGWVNEGAQVVRLPIERAKDLVLERGLPSRPASTAPQAAPSAPAPAAVPAAHTAGH